MNKLILLTVNARRQNEMERERDREGWMVRERWTGTRRETMKDRQTDTVHWDIAQQQLLDHVSVTVSYHPYR